MDILFIIILVIFFIGILFLIVKQLKTSSFSTKSQVVKKSEIIDGYKKTLDGVDGKIERTRMLKQINQELALNIFFDQDEIRKAMQELTMYSIK